MYSRLAVNIISKIECISHIKLFRHMEWMNEWISLTAGLTWDISVPTTLQAIWKFHEGLYRSAW